MKNLEALSGRLDKSICKRFRRKSSPEINQAAMKNFAIKIKFYETANFMCYRNP